MSDSQQAGLIANDHVGSGADYQQYNGPEATPAPYGAPQNQDRQIGFRDLANAIVDLGTLICLLISYGITVALGAGPATCYHNQTQQRHSHAQPHTHWSAWL